MGHREWMCRVWCKGRGCSVAGYMVAREEAGAELTPASKVAARRRTLHKHQWQMRVNRGAMRAAHELASGSCCSENVCGCGVVVAAALS